MRKEAEIMEDMRTASPQDQRLLTAELTRVRAIAAQEKQAAAEIDLADSIIRESLTPVRVHGMHTTATDWLDEGPSYTNDDLGKVSQSMRVQASQWYSHLSEGVKSDYDELAEQARGVARRVAGQYGEIAGDAADVFMDYIGHLVTLAEGTDAAGVPSAAGDSSNPELDDWSDTPGDADVEGRPVGTIPAPDPSPEGLDTGPAAPDPTASNPPEEPTNTGGSAGPNLDEENVFDTSSNAAQASKTAADNDDDEDDGKSKWAWSAEDNGGSRTAYFGRDESWTHHNPSNRHHQDPWHPRHDDQDPGAEEDELPTNAATSSLISRAAQQFIAMEEGQPFPTPGERETEQSGEAGSSLPEDVSWDRQKEVFPSFADTPKEDAAAVSSERAPNVRATKASYSIKDNNGNTVAGPFDAEQDANQALASQFGSDAQSKGFNIKEEDSAPVHASKTAWAPSNSGIGKHLRSAHGWSDSDTDDTPQALKHQHDSQYSDCQAKTAIATEPNTQGSRVYDPAIPTDKGYEEGYYYALLWEPGKPVPAALSSAAAIGHKYNAEYVAGYRTGLLEGIATLGKDVQAAFEVEAAHHQVLARSDDASPDYYSKDDASRKVHPGHVDDQHGAQVDPWGRTSDDFYFGSKQAVADPSLGGDQLQLEDTDNTPSTPNTFDDANSKPGSGATDVANVPTPGSAPGDYPQPSSSGSGPAIGNGQAPLAPWPDTGNKGGDTPQASSLGEEKLSAFRARVQASLRAESGSGIDPRDLIGKHKSMGHHGSIDGCPECKAFKKMMNAPIGNL